MWQLEMRQTLSLDRYIVVLVTLALVSLHCQRYIVML